MSYIPNTSALPEGTNLYYTDARARAAISTTATGLAYDNLTGILSLAAGYVIPTTTEETNWNTAYGWGDHSAAGYLTAETDPVFGAWLAGPPNISTFTNDSGYLTAETDPVFGAWLSAPPNISTFTNDSGYLTAEVDPIFGVSPAAGIGAGDIINWNTAYGWGNHAGLYDPAGTAAAAVGAHEGTYNHATYDTAYGWGDHALAGYITAGAVDIDSGAVAGAAVSTLNFVLTGSDYDKIYGVIHTRNSSGVVCNYHSGLNNDTAANYCRTLHARGTGVEVADALNIFSAPATGNYLTIYFVLDPKQDLKGDYHVMIQVEYQQVGSQQTQVSTITWTNPLAAADLTQIDFYGSNGAGVPVAGFCVGTTYYVRGIKAA